MVRTLLVLLEEISEFELVVAHGFVLDTICKLISRLVVFGFFLIVVLAIPTGVFLFIVFPFIIFLNPAQAIRKPSKYPCKIMARFCLSSSRLLCSCAYLCCSSAAPCALLIRLSSA